MSSPSESIRALDPGRRGLVRALVRRGFAPVAREAAARYAWMGRIQKGPPPDRWWGSASSDGAARLVVILPTLADRCELEDLWRAVQGIQVSMERAEAPAGRRVECGLVVAMQARASSPGLVDERLLALEAKWRAAGRSRFLGLALDRPSKILALNAARAAVAAAGADAVAWFDDDVLIDPDCLRLLYERFDPSTPGIWGARKIALPDRSDFSRRWARLKNRVEPVNKYPHGCGVLMSVAEFLRGIPADYQSDDNYFLFRHLDVNASDPGWKLMVEPRALVYVPSANEVGSTVQRIARNYRNGLRIMVDASPGTGRYYLRSILFPALRAPRAFSEVLTRPYWSALGWQALKLGFWLGVVADVCVRGVFNRARQPIWYSAPFPSGAREACERK